MTNWPKKNIVEYELPKNEYGVDGVDQKESELT